MFHMHVRVSVETHGLSIDHSPIASKLWGRGTAYSRGYEGPRFGDVAILQGPLLAPISFA